VTFFGSSSNGWLAASATNFLDYSERLENRSYFGPLRQTSCPGRESNPDSLQKQTLINSCYKRQIFSMVLVIAASFGKHHFALICGSGCQTLAKPSIL
jgi:hypothetical protein